MYLDIICLSALEPSLCKVGAFHGTGVFKIDTRELNTAYWVLSFKAPCTSFQEEDTHALWVLSSDVSIWESPILLHMPKKRHGLIRPDYVPLGPPS